MALVLKKGTACQWCAAVNCSNSRFKNPELSFFRFPKDPERCRRWVINCRRADLDNKSSSVLHSGGYVLCEKHFEESYIRKNEHRSRLLKEAIPTLFAIPNPPQRLTSSRPLPKKRICVENAQKDITPSSPTPSCSSVQEQTIEDLESTVRVHSTVNSSLKKKLKAEQTKAWRLRKKLKLKSNIKAQQEAAAGANDSYDLHTLKCILAIYISGPALEFVFTQIRMAKLCKRRRRWTNQDKSLALSIYHCSRKAYRLLQKIFNLPSPQTLNLAMKNVYIKPGKCRNLMNLFKVKVKAMTLLEKQCVLVFDEVCLKSGLKYNPQDDEVEGFEDFGHLGRSQKPATHALVFMVRGLTISWKQACSYVLSSGPVRGQMLKPLLLDMLEDLFSIGLHPRLIVCDQGSNNRSLFKQLGITAQQPYFYCDGDKVFAMYDPPHLIKNIRNNLKKYGFSVEDKMILWDHIVQFYQTDSKLPIRMAPKLTKRHMEVPAFSHLRVYLAAQVLSHSVAAGITAMVTFGVLPPEAENTANFVERFERLFNAFNGRGFKSKRTMSHPITPTADHMDFLMETLNWLDRVKCNNKSGSVPCLEGWKLTITSLMQFWEEIKETDLSYIFTSRLNQDCLENLFAIIRGKGGHRVNPDPSEFRAALRQTMVDSVMITSKRQNCKEDLDSFLFSLDNLVSEGGPTTIKSRLLQDVPQPLRKMMQTSATPTLSLIEQNIMAYIAGYVVNKLSPLLCQACISLISGDNIPSNDKFVFLNKKNFEDCAHGGLKTPSQTLLGACEKFETIFRDFAPAALHSSGLRNHIIRRMIETETPQLMCTSEKACDVKFYVVNLFTNIRLHHHIRMFNINDLVQKGGKKSSGSRKAALFNHL